MLASLAWLKALPYSSSQLVEMAPSRASAPPSGSGFSMGPLVWDLSLYARNPSLDVFRQYERERCGDATGTAAAVCLSKEFARQFPHGDPEHEFVEAHYDPAADLLEHLSGRPGHCLTRSGLMATALLASGIPARVAQFVSERGGHTVVEVWSAKANRWVVVDATWDGTLSNGTSPLSAEGAVTSGTVIWVPRGPLPASAPVSISTMYGPSESAILPGSELMYPDPWLYTRTGKNAASAPFRAAFVHVGGRQWQVGPAQTLARSGCVTFGLLFVVSAAFGFRRRTRRTRRETKPVPCDGDLGRESTRGAPNIRLGD